jgi:hypothetical protein
MMLERVNVDMRSRYNDKQFISIQLIPNPTFYDKLPRPMDYLADTL